MKKAQILCLLLALAVGITTGCAARDSRADTDVAPSGPSVTASNDPSTIPSGTSIAIRTNENIEVRDENAGTRTYSAEMAQDVVTQDGRTLVPKGSPVQLTVVKNEGGTLGTDRLLLGIQSITINGRSYNVSTGSVEREGDAGLGTNRRTATMVGGGALLGTLIGAAAGGGSGAAVGAAVGAAGGAAAQVLTKGDEIRVPAESVLEFRLDQPIQLVGYSGQ
jgi:hypothetical protein